MNITLKRWPKVTIKKIPDCQETRQFFLTPGILVGRGYFTIFWIHWMMTINFNTTLEWESEK